LWTVVLYRVVKLLGPYSLPLRNNNSLLQKNVDNELSDI
jgi:hypothetical protein